MSKYKVGDKVVCVNTDWYDEGLTFGEVYTVAGNTFYGEVCIEGFKGSFMEKRFELMQCNGVDKDDNPKHFTDDMLKDWMIVKTRDGSIGTIKTNNCKDYGACILYLNRYGFDLAKIIYEDHSELSITEIYDLRDSIGFILRKECNTDEKYLIWKAIEPVKETEQQKAIRELEESIKASTDKLQALKETL